MNKGDWQKRAVHASKICEECGKIFGPKIGEHGYQGEIMFRRQRFCSPHCSTSYCGKERYEKERKQAAERERRKGIMDAAVNRFLYNK